MSNRKQHNRKGTDDKQENATPRMNENQSVNSTLLMRVRKKRHLSGLMCPPLRSVESAIANRDKDRD